MSGFFFDDRSGYTIVRFESTLPDMSWGDVESEAAEISDKLRKANTGNVIVDLTPMTLIQSGLVASMVRMWKATEEHPKRQLVVAAPSDVVKEVLRSAGLFKVFTVVDSLTDASTEIGAAKLEFKYKSREVARIGGSSWLNSSPWIMAIVMLIVGVAAGAVVAMYFANSGNDPNSKTTPVHFFQNNNGPVHPGESEDADNGESEDADKWTSRLRHPPKTNRDNN
ncbi:MAG: STAS domain-containing protein [Fuerstiella sp.]|nr:STAS domain-containing protein [Fuerstiella sp.]